MNVNSHDITYTSSSQNAGTTPEESWPEVPGSEYTPDYSPDGRYGRETRLQNIISAICVMGTHEKSRMLVNDWERILGKPICDDKGWENLFTAHPEFFKVTRKKTRNPRDDQDTKEETWAALKVRLVAPEGKLDVSNIEILTKLAVELQNRHIAYLQEKRWKITTFAPAIASAIAAAAAIAGAIISFKASHDAAAASSNATIRAADVKGQLDTLQKQLESKQGAGSSNAAGDNAKRVGSPTTQRSNK